MTASWGGAQWVLAMWLVLVTVGAPALRAALVQEGFTPPKRHKTWGDYWKWWAGEVVARITLVAVLAWGGFWS